MAFRIATKLGIWDVDGMLDAMPLKLFREWACYYVLEPFGEERADLRLALINAAVASLGGNKNVKVEDFIFSHRGARGEESASDRASRLRNKFMMFAKQHNAFMRSQGG